MKVEALAGLLPRPQACPVHTGGPNERWFVDEGTYWWVLEGFSVPLWLSQERLVTLECSVPGREPQRCGEVGAG